MHELALLALCIQLFPGGLDVHVGHLLTVRVFDEVLGLSHSGARAVDARYLELSYPCMACIAPAGTRPSHLASGTSAHEHEVIAGSWRACSPGDASLSIIGFEDEMTWAGRGLVIRTGTKGDEWP